jgi:hypothetical protein
MANDPTLIELNIELRRVLGDASPRQAASLADIAMQWSRRPDLPVDTTQAGLETARMDDFWDTLRKNGLETLSVAADGVQRDVNVREVTDTLTGHLGNPLAEGLDKRATASFLLGQRVYTQLQDRLTEVAGRATGGNQEFLEAARQHVGKVLFAMQRYSEGLQRRAQFLE